MRLITIAVGTLLFAFATSAQAKQDAMSCLPDNNGRSVCSIAQHQTERHVRYARHTRHERHTAQIEDANGNVAGVVRSRKTGAIAHVSAAYSPAFQAYIDKLEASGAEVRFMGGYRRGHGSLAHQHPLGLALDVCQRSRDVVDPRCHLPPRMQMVAIARSVGLYEGGEWCNGDRGHVQAKLSALPCGEKTYAARRHVHHRRYARR